MTSFPLRRILLGPQGDPEVRRPLPGWANLMINLADRVLAFDPYPANLFLVLLTPTRQCFSHFLALGTLISSAASGYCGMSWSEFLLLEERMTVYLLYPRRTNNRATRVPVSATIVSPAGEVPRRLEVHEPLRSILEIRERNFSNYHVSRHPYPTRHRSSRLNSLRDFFQYVVSDFEPLWLLATGALVAVITEVAPWKRCAADVTLHLQSHADQPDQTWPLDRLLMLGHDDQQGGAKTLLLSPVRDPQSAPPTGLAIFDGPNALRAAELTRARRNIVLLENHEYRPDVQHRIRQLVSSRLENACPARLLESLPLLPGMQLITFFREGDPS